MTKATDKRTIHQTNKHDSSSKYNTSTSNHSTNNDNVLGIGHSGIIKHKTINASTNTMEQQNDSIEIAIDSTTETSDSLSKNISSKDQVTMNNNSTEEFNEFQPSVTKQSSLQKTNRTTRTSNAKQHDIKGYIPQDNDSMVSSNDTAQFSKSLHGHYKNTDRQTDSSKHHTTHAFLQEQRISASEESSTESEESSTESEESSTESQFPQIQSHPQCNTAINKRKTTVEPRSNASISKSNAAKLTNTSAIAMATMTTPYGDSFILPPKSIWRDSFAYIVVCCTSIMLIQWKGNQAWAFLSARLSSRAMVVMATFVLPNTCFWLFALAMSCFDMMDGPHARLLPRKHQKGRRVQWNDFRKAVKQTLFNQVVIGAPVTAGMYWLWERVHGRTALPLPTYSEFLRDILIYAVAVEFFFYYGHRFLHWSRIYRYIHKRHHEFTAPIAVAALYCHPVEHVLANMLPVFAGPFIAGSHLLCLCIWLCVANINAVNSHCGYTLPGMPSSLQHDFHHYRFRNNYGVLGLLDWLHGTSKVYDSFLAMHYKRVDAAAAQGSTTANCSSLSLTKGIQCE